MTTAAVNTTAPEIKAGAFFVSRWGCEQTNVTFYMVQAVTAKTVTVQEVGTRQVQTGEQSMTYTATPDTDKTWGKPVRKTVMFWNDEPQLKMSNHEYARLWTGKPVAGTSYA